MIKNVFVWSLFAVMGCLNAATSDDAEHLPSIHPTMRIISDRTHDLNNAIEALRGNDTVTSLTFCACLKNMEMPKVAEIINTMSALKVLRFVDEHAQVLTCVTPAVFARVNVFIGTSKPELFMRRVRILDLRLSEGEK